MEPTDLDRLVKARLEQGNEAHKKEMQRAKPFVWSAIQREITPSGRFRWGYVAAAVIALLLSFLFIFRSLQYKHKQELAMLSEQVDHLNQNYTQQVSSTNMKNQQLKELLDEIRELKYKLDEIEREQPVDVARDRIVYRTDTIYIREVEYITRTEPPTVIDEENELQGEYEDESMQSQNAIVQHAIYPGNNTYTADHKTEKVRVRFGNLGAKSN